MKVVEVNNNKLISDFLNLPKSLYKQDSEWVCPLDQDIEDVFNPELNANFKGGNAKRWILVNDKNKTIGRVAAFYNEKYFLVGEKKTGAMGFFECINDQAAANLLYETCVNWLKSFGIEAMDGPVNFGEKDKYWGLMVSGFKNPSYQENYNFPYYQSLFENFGFLRITEQTTSEITYNDFNYDRFSKLASRVMSNPAYTFEHFKMNQLEKYAGDFIHIYNLAWASRADFVPITRERIESTLRSLKPILMEDAIWFVYANGEPAGFFVNVIDVNQIFKHLNGKLDLWGKIKFLWFRKFGDISRVRGIVFGVIPQYHNLGLETGMIMRFYESMQKHPKLKTAELAWIGDFNPKMHSLLHSLGAKTTKIHYTYRYQF
ncbi:MAG: GNAT family N-acetyltransferase [Bacteroidia bacterium]